MNCDDFRTAFLSGDVDDHHTHLEGCAECRRLVPDLAATRTMLADPATWEEPGPGMGDTVVALVEAASSDGSGKHGSSGGDRGSVRRWRLFGVAAAIVAMVAVAGTAIALRAPSPDWETRMGGTTAAPGAAATVAGWTEDGGTRMVLSIEGLDPAPEGYVYEMWMSEARIHVSAGTFRGGDTVDLWAGVARRDYPRLWVTLEPVDDDESPSRTTVLDTG